MADANITNHLANERTFLAWVRTSIALMGFGVVIARLRFTLIETQLASQNLSPSAGTRSTLLGIVFASIGLLTLLFAMVHYQRARKMIDSGEYKPMGGAITGFAFVIVALGVVSIVYLLSLFPR